MNRPFFILALDPGNTESGLVLLEGNAPPLQPRIRKAVILSNATILQEVQTLVAEHDQLGFAVETVASYGMAVGRTVFETCFFTGRCVQVAFQQYREVKAVYRKDVKTHLCHSMKAKDGNIRQAIIDRYEPSGGGSVPQIGNKAQPGPLYGIRSHLWAALGVGLTAADCWNELTWFPGTAPDPGF